VRRRNLHQREVEGREWKEESSTPRLYEVDFVGAGDVRWADVMVCCVHDSSCPFLIVFLKASVGVVSL
jgi:hypothetical protein